jgi:hypothetical protein
MLLRISAIETFAGWLRENNLGNDKLGIAIHKRYVERVREIQALISN